MSITFTPDNLFPEELSNYLRLYDIGTSDVIQILSILILWKPSQYGPDQISSIFAFESTPPKKEILVDRNSYYESYLSAHPKIKYTWFSAVNKNSITSPERSRGKIYTNSDSVLYLINPFPFLITSSLNDIQFNSGQYAILNNKHTNYGEKFIPISLTIERLWQRQYYYQHGRNF